MVGELQEVGGVYFLTEASSLEMVVSSEMALGIRLAMKYRDSAGVKTTFLLKY